jgi:hypothetical protein
MSDPTPEMNHAEAVVNVRRVSNELLKLDENSGRVHVLGMTMLNEFESKAQAEEAAAATMREQAAASEAKARAFRSLHTTVFNAINTQLIREQQEIEKEAKKKKELAENKAEEKKEAAAKKKASKKKASKTKR